MFLNHRHLIIRSTKTLFRSYSVARKNPYDILNLRRNCTDKDIKEAFIQLSKEYHPDKNKDKKAQEKFVEIVEAYNLLGKPSSRAQYDSMTVESSYSYVYRTHVPYNLRKNPKYSYYNASQSTESTTNESTNYSETNSKKLPNYVVIAICAGVAVVGVIVQTFFIRNMYMMQRKRAQEKSQLLAEELDKIRAAGFANGNEVQTRLLLEKIVKAANPTVATASLGQALANEKE